jgi:primosomal protein N' (replication factor Y)
VAVVRPLRLKREIAARVHSTSAENLPVIRVWVDNSVYHLDSVYDYLVPESLDSQIAIGIRVEVPFNGRVVEAIVLKRLPQSETVKLKFVLKVISMNPVATAETLSLIEAVASRWASHPYDVIRSAIPPRAATVDREQFTHLPKINHLSKPARKFLQLPPAKSRAEVIAAHIQSLSTQGRVLVVVPDTRLLKRLSELLPDAVPIDSHLDRTDRYRNFLRALHGSSDIYIGTRSAIFAPVPDLAVIVVIDEGSENHYEKRSPGWNVRDVAILRSQLQKVSLDFIGYSPSSEVARLIELKWIDYQAVRQKVSVQNFQQSTSELLPGRIISEIRKALTIGPVLFIASRKGYSQAISCARCRNIALCECGGKLFKGSAQSKAACALCSKIHDPWVCAWCRNETPFLIGRGSSRFAQEIGAAFPGQQISSSEGDHILETYISNRGIVVATPGSIPEAQDGYSAVVILEGDSYFSQSDIRAQERARELFFSAAGKLAKDGKCLLVLSHDNPLIGALTSWKPSLLSQRELREREEVALPPYVRALSLDTESSEIPQLLRGLQSARNENRLPESSRILGPIELRNDQSRILIMAPVSEGEELVKFIHEYQRRRSVSKKTLSTLRIDPYSLTR